MSAKKMIGLVITVILLILSLTFTVVYVRSQLVLGEESQIITVESTINTTNDTSLVAEKNEVPTVPFDGVFELPIEGSSGYNSIYLELKAEANKEATVIRNLPIGTPYTIIREEAEWLQVKVNNDVGWIESRFSLINLPDIIPSIIYDVTNVSHSIFKSSGIDIPNITNKKLYNSIDFNERLNKEEYIVPVLFPMARKIMNAQKLALDEGHTLIIYEGYRPDSVQKRIATELQSLASVNKDVMTGINNPPWEIDWFISTKISNHQIGYAIDVSLGKINHSVNQDIGKYHVQIIDKFEVLPMQTDMHELSLASAIYTQPINSLSNELWKSEVLSPNVHENTKLLQKYLTSSDLTPLASEWWHFNDLDALEKLEGNTGIGDFEIIETVSEIPK